MSRIKTVVFDKHERPSRATVITQLGIVKVEWREVCGDRGWFTSGTLDAKKLAVSSIQKIERLVSDL
jgi:hypothetical protein